MTEKVKLTREQADAIDTMARATKGMLVVDLLRAIQEGYDVEPEYKVGDWIVRLNGTTFLNDKAVVRVDKVSDIHLFYDHDIGIDKIRIRHATPEEIKVEQERRVWAKIGREVGEFRKGDVRITKGTVSGFVRTNCEKNAKDEYENGELKGFYPAESFISFEEVESNA
ncbi:hypothetical protein [Sporosarcina psychrophila]|uniref:Uncharacterized protein n=1 Tax=Sporosarcina psychrophila TaxID=1476 RepID=A0ABV2K9X9_SPOPS